MNPSKIKITDREKEHFITDHSGFKQRHLTPIIPIKRVGFDIIWLCACDCGKTKALRITDVIRPVHPTNSCGCMLPKSDPERRKRLDKQRAQSRRDCAKVTGICPRCGKNPVYEFSNCEGCRDKNNVRNKKKEAILKKLVFDEYGRACTCCGQNFDDKFLTLDHVNNDGRDHRKTLTTSIYSWAVKNKYPNTLQTHCWNCNMGKNLNGGICPHREVSA